MNVKKKCILNKTLPIAVLTVMVSHLLAACNSKEEDGPVYEPTATVAVKKFSLSPNARIMTDLDSVYFSIDLDRGYIFNADSLPKGTPVDKIVPVITFPSSVAKAVIEMKGGKTREGIVDYKENPTDTIDFSGNVTLTLSTEDETLRRTYSIKINVHKMVADSLMWDKVATSYLPSLRPDPKEQRSVSLGEQVITLIRESDNSVTLARCLNPADNNWRKLPLTLPFAPELRTLNATEDALFILSEDGDLYKSSDGETWLSTGVNWINIIGGYGKSLLGLSADPAGKIIHDIFPRPEGYTPVEADPEFPVKGFSQFHSFSSKWAVEPMGFLTGGERNGKLSGGTWSFDGSEWAMIANTPLPPLTEALVIPYFNYKKTAASWIQTEYSVWLCLGGKLASGEINPDVYMSYDNGVNWQKAPSLLQLPKHVNPSCKADAIIRTTPKSASIDSYWKPLSTPPPHGAKIHYFVDGSDVDWDCPYIYMFGGESRNGQLHNVIMRAVLARLTFTPLF